MNNPSPHPQAATLPPSQRKHQEARASGYPPVPPLTRGSTKHKHDTKEPNTTSKHNYRYLNMNGYAAPTQNMTGMEKWSAVYNTIKEYKIAILALQETHLDKETLHSVNECFG